MTISVNASRTHGQISPLIYGAVDEWFNRYFMETSSYYEDAVRKIKALGLKCFRIGGSPSRFYHWKEPRGFSRTSGYLEKYQFNVATIDSLMKFVKASDVETVLISTNFVRGTAKEASEWVRYCNVEREYDIRYWEIDNELGYPGMPSWFRGDPEKYYFGGCALQQGEEIGVSEGLPFQCFSVGYPPVRDGLTVYVGSTPWQQVDDVTSVGKGKFYQYNESLTDAFYYKGEILFGDGKNGGIPPRGALISADYNSGPHDGLIDFISQMKAVDPSIRVAPCGDELDWWHNEVTEWTRRLFELDSQQEDPQKEFDFITPHWHTILLGDGPLQALHRMDNFEHAVAKVRGMMSTAYSKTKPHKVDMPIFIDEWKAVFWDPPVEQGLWSALFVANGLGLFARNGITQASLTHVYNYIRTDGLLGYERRHAEYGPNEPMPISYAFQLVANKFGKIVVDCTCTGSALCAYASLGGDGGERLCLLVVNRDFTYDIKSTITLEGFRPKGTADAWILNGQGIDTDAGMNINGVELRGMDVADVNAISPVKIGQVSDGFEFSFPAHSVTIMHMTSY